ncbi:ATP-binding cassette domain-containing protein [Bacillus mangrovi]|uniref:ATP-binding cassette domain-containing protein n=1 Tax=Metabacillus mangrovi TaxID=1491830 RepID=A0A7X2V4I8_9BACI|nr:ATP-binding cassette domain-containing protein [Metabacillus mangrovi]
MIEVRNLVKEYKTKKGKVTGVDHVSLHVKRGEIFGIVGYSGAGKSSLLRCLNLLEKPSSGEILIDGIPLTSLRKAELRKARLKIGMIFQHFHLVSSKTVFENISFALKAAHKNKAEIDKRVTELLEMVGLSDKRNAYPAQLSGGQKQRVGIARALANDPSVLLCDEATSALDPSTTQSILSLLKKINRELGLTIVLITHEMDVVKEVCDRMAVMQNGAVVEEGHVYDLFTNPANPLTKEFINTILQFSIPASLLSASPGKIVKIFFQGAAAGEAVISDALQTFKVKGNILHGKIEYIKDVPLGIFIIELTGDPAEVDRAIHYIQSRTEKLEVIQDAA